MTHAGCYLTARGISLLYNLKTIFKTLIDMDPIFLLTVMHLSMN